jgi:hypothetical protein
MTDTAIGFVLLGIALVVVLGVVFVIASRGGPATEPPKPPQGVHMPGPSFLPVVLSVGAALLGAGLAFRGEWGIANPFLAVPGLLVLVAGIVSWVRAANHEWRETEHGSHDGGAAH